MDTFELTDRAEVRHCIVEDCGTLYAPSPTLSLCRHAEQGCGVEAKKSPVAAKGPAHERAAIVDETRENSTGGDCGAVRGGGGVSLRARDRGLGHGHGDSSQHSTQAYNFFLPFTSTLLLPRVRDQDAG